MGEGGGAATLVFRFEIIIMEESSGENTGAIHTAQSHSEPIRKVNSRIDNQVIRKQSGYVLLYRSLEFKQYQGLFLTGNAFLVRRTLKPSSRPW